jgi:hypothetical protein
LKKKNSSKKVLRGKTIVSKSNVKKIKNKVKAKPIIKRLSKSEQRASVYNKFHTSPEVEALEEPTTERLWEILAKGRNRGFLTEVEVGQVMPHPEYYIELYEGFLDLMERHGVSVVEPVTPLDRTYY